MLTPAYKSRRTGWASLVRSPSGTLLRAMKSTSATSVSWRRRVRKRRIRCVVVVVVVVGTWAGANARTDERQLPCACERPCSVGGHTSLANF